MTEFRPGGFQQLPVIVKNLLIINVLVFLIQQLFAARGILINGNSFEDVFALHYWGSPKFGWWQLFTHMFMHGNIMHIVFNMFPLWMFGRILENVWGPKRFLFFYLICGVGAALCHLGVLTYEFMPFHHAFVQYQRAPNINDFLVLGNKYQVDITEDSARSFLFHWEQQPNSIAYASQSIEILKTHMNAATLGASGAVFGILFAFGYLFPNTLLYLYFAIPVKAKWFVAGYALLELFSGVRNSAGDNVAHFAHLGGMLFAFILLRIWNKRNRSHFY